MSYEEAKSRVEKVRSCTPDIWSRAAIMQSCKNCGYPYQAHADAKCLFDNTSYVELTWSEVEKLWQAYVEHIQSRHT